MISLQLALRQLRRHFSIHIPFLAILTVGFWALSIVLVFKTSVQTELESRSKAYLGADLGIISRRPFTDQDLATIQNLSSQGIRLTEVRELYTMVSAKENSRLAQLRVVERAFPFYGEIDVSQPGQEPRPLAEVLHESDKIAVYPELLAQMDLEVGDRVTIGTAEFEIGGVVAEDSGNLLSIASVAPRIYLSEKYVDRTGLIQKGSTVWYTWLAQLPDNTQVEAMIRNLNQDLKEPGVRVYSHSAAAERSGRVLSYLGDYLGLSGLIALFLAGLGASFLYRKFFRERISEIATMLSLGLRRREAQSIYLIQGAIIGVMAAVIALALTVAVFPILSGLMSQFTSFELEVTWSAWDFLMILVLGAVGSWFLSWPFLASLRTLNPSLLFQESAQTQWRFSWSMVAYGLILAVGFWVLSVGMTMSVRAGSTFSGLFFFSLALTLAGTLVFIRVLGRVFHGTVKELRWALRAVTRQSWQTTTVVSVLALAVCLITLILCLHNSLHYKLRITEGERPTLFLFDIQEDQISPLTQFLEDAEHPLQEPSAMVRARLVAVNNEPFDKLTGADTPVTREQEDESLSRNRSYNLTYRTGLSASEEIIKGYDFPGPYDPESDELPLISVEQEFAERLSWKVGDVLEFDVQGVPVQGRIANFRKVDWTTFQPNFFVLFQEGVLNAAPKTFVASIGELTFDQKNQLQAEIVRRFPNISIIDITRVIEKALDIIAKSVSTLHLMGALTLFAGFVVLVAMIRSSIGLRRREMNLYKILGADQLSLRRSLLWEFLLLGLFATALGLLVGAFSSYWIVLEFYDGSWRMPAWLAPGLLVLVPGLCVFFGILTSWRLFSEKAVLWLQD